MTNDPRLHCTAPRACLPVRRRARVGLAHILRKHHYYVTVAQITAQLLLPPSPPLAINYFPTEIGLDHGADRPRRPPIRRAGAQPSGASVEHTCCPPISFVKTLASKSADRIIGSQAVGGTGRAS